MPRDRVRPTEGRWRRRLLARPACRGGGVADRIVVGAGQPILNVTCAADCSASQAMSELSLQRVRRCGLDTPTTTPVGFARLDQPPRIEAPWIEFRIAAGETVRSGKAGHPVEANWTPATIFAGRQRQAGDAAFVSLRSLRSPCSISEPRVRRSPTVRRKPKDARPSEL